MKHGLYRAFRIGPLLCGDRHGQMLKVESTAYLREIAEGILDLAGILDMECLMP